MPPHACSLARERTRSSRSAFMLPPSRNAAPSVTARPVENHLLRNPEATLSYVDYLERSTVRQYHAAMEMIH